MSKTLTWLIPNLIPDLKEQSIIKKTSEYRHLIKTLLRAKRVCKEETTFEHQVVSLFLKDICPPIAPLLALAFNLPAQNGWWVCMKPVHLLADLAGVYLIGNPVHEYDQDELTALLEVLRNYLAEEKIILYTPSVSTWLLNLNEAPDFISPLPKQLMGKEISDYLPKGPNQKKWRLLQMEIQMLLHQHPVTQRRIQSGKKIINSVWFYGAAQLPKPNSVIWTSIVGDNALTHGLARLHDVPYQSMADNFAEYLVASFNSRAKGNCLVVTEKLYDYHSQVETESFLKNYWQPSLQALINKKIDKLIVHSNQFTFYLNRYYLRRYWRSMRSMKVLFKK